MCPVDVQINRNGELLSSKKYAINSSYGRLDFAGENGDIKSLCLDDDGYNYNIDLNGTDTGTMDLLLRWYDEDGNVSTEKTFYEIPVTEKTLMSISLQENGTSELNVDNDGDGTADDTWYSAEGDVGYRIIDAVNASNYATTVTTESGTAPVLPATATVEYDNCEAAENVPIEWEEVKPEQYSDIFGGEFEVKGMVEGLDVTCLVKVNQASITEISQPKDEVIERYISVYPSHFWTKADYTEDLTITWGNGAKTTETAVFEGGVDDGENFVAPEYVSRQTEDKYNSENKEKLDAVRKKVTVVTHSIKDVALIPPSKTTYNVGEESDNKGAKFVVTYDDGTTREYSNEENDPDNPDRVRIYFMGLPVEPGTHTMTATLVGTGYTGTYEVTILKDKKHFEITKVPTKTTYYVDEEIDLEGSLYFAGSTFTGTQGTITKEMIGDYNRTEGVQKIPVYYTFDDGDRVEAFFEVLYIAKEEPIEDPTEELTEDPNEEPTEEPTEDPNEEPTEEPTDPNKEQTKPTEEQKQPAESSSDSNGKQKDSGEANNKQSNVTKVQPSQSNITQGTAVQQGVVQKSTSGTVAQVSKTGDTNLTALWITLSAVSAGIVTVMVVVIRKRRAE